MALGLRGLVLVQGLGFCVEPQDTYSPALFIVGTPQVRQYLGAFNGVFGTDTCRLKSLSAAKQIPCQSC